jgi:glycosyltransferase involved in cell wall biosynthesis
MSIRTTEKLRVLMVTPRYLPYMGGIETHVYEVGRRLVQCNVDVTILTTMPSMSETPLPREAESEGMHVIRVPVLLKRNDFYIAPEMYSLIKEGAWDLVHCQGCHTFVPPLAMTAARKAHIPFVVTFHTGGHSSSLRTKIRSTQWRILRPLLVDAERLIGVSQFEAEYFSNLLHIPSERFSVIPNGATLPALSRPLQLTTDRTLIVSLGRLERYKGHQHMILALPKIRERRPDAQLLILGVGPYENALRKLAQEVGVADYVEIRAIPSTDRKAMTRILSEASLVALMSEYEAHPIAVMEALSLRCPVLGMDAAGMRELAERKLICSIPLNSSPEAVAIAALQQIEEPLIPGDIALPTWDESAEMLLDVYQSVCPVKQLQTVSL